MTSFHGWSIVVTSASSEQLGDVTNPALRNDPHRRKLLNPVAFVLRNMSPSYRAERIARDLSTHAMVVSRGCPKRVYDRKEVELT